LENVGEKMKRLRESLGMKQKEVAEMLGINSSLLCRYEKGTYQPKYDVLVKLASIYKVPVSYFFAADNGKSKEETSLARIDLENVIRVYPNLNLFGTPLDETSREDLLKIIRVIWKVICRRRKVYGRVRRKNKQEG